MQNMVSWYSNFKTKIVKVRTYNCQDFANINLFLLKWIKVIERFRCSLNKVIYRKMVCQSVLNLYRDGEVTNNTICDIPIEGRIQWERENLTSQQREKKRYNMSTYKLKYRYAYRHNYLH